MIKTFNLFRSHSNDPLQAQRETQATRLYFTLVTVAFITLALFYTLVENTNQYSVSHPSYERFITLKQKYGATLRCDCYRSDFIFNDFASIEVTYHPICSSEFVSQTFIDQLFRINSTPTYQRDFVTMSGMYFKSIAMYCQWIGYVVEYKRMDALEGGFDYNYLIDSAEFNQTVERITNTFQISAIKYVNGDLAELLEFLINTHSLSTSQNSFIMPITSNGSVLIHPVDLNNCSCLLYPKICSTEAGFYRYEPRNYTFIRVSNLLGIRAGCSPFYSMFHSSLACWYSRECYDQVNLLADRVLCLYTCHMYFLFRWPLIGKNTCWHSRSSLHYWMQRIFITSTFLIPSRRLLNREWSINCEQNRTFWHISSIANLNCALIPWSNARASSWLS